MRTGLEGVRRPLPAVFSARTAIDCLYATVGLALIAIGAVALRNRPAWAPGTPTCKLLVGLGSVALGGAFVDLCVRTCRPASTGAGTGPARTAPAGGDRPAAAAPAAGVPDDDLLYLNDPTYGPARRAFRAGLDAQVPLTVEADDARMRQAALAVAPIDAVREFTRLAAARWETAPAADHPYLELGLLERAFHTPGALPYVRQHFARNLAGRLQAAVAPTQVRGYLLAALSDLNLPPDALSVGMATWEELHSGLRTATRAAATHLCREELPLIVASLRQPMSPAVRTAAERSAFDTIAAIWLLTDGTLDREVATQLLAWSHSVPPADAPVHTRWIDPDQMLALGPLPRAQGVFGPAYQRILDMWPMPALDGSTRGFSLGPPMSVADGLLRAAQCTVALLNAAAPAEARRQLAQTVIDHLLCSSAHLCGEARFS